jgi:hypothetical protein
MPGLETCPSCGSALVQGLSASRQDDGRLAVELRCPECEARVCVIATHAQVLAYEELCDQGREAIRRAHERCVTESMEALADVLGRALALDLLTADDFAAGRTQGPLVRRLRPAG